MQPVAEFAGANLPTSQSAQFAPVAGAYLPATQLLPVVPQDAAPTLVLPEAQALHVGIAARSWYCPAGHSAH